MINIQPKFNAAIECEEGFIRISFSRVPDTQILSQIKALAQKPSFRVVEAVYSEVYSELNIDERKVIKLDALPLDWHITFSLAYDCGEVAQAIKEFLESEHGLKCRLILNYDNNEGDDNYDNNEGDESKLIKVK